MRLWPRQESWGLRNAGPFRALHSGQLQGVSGTQIPKGSFLGKQDKGVEVKAFGEARMSTPGFLQPH